MGRLANVTLVMFACLFIATGCVDTSKQRTDVALQEASRLQEPSVSLDQYTKFKLQPMVLKGEVSADTKKVAAAKDLESRLQTKLQSLLDGWQKPGNGSTLVIQPVLQSLYIVSAGSRFWIGGMAGNSSIDMDLVLIDEATGKKIASPRIQRDASAMGGAWSVGATDKNLPNYIVEIAYEYLARNYKK